MASIAQSPLAGSTIAYNGVQWGGSDATYKSLPPTYAIRGEFVYDEAERVVTGIDYTLTVSGIFYEDTEVLLSTNMDAMRNRLSSPGKALAITGLGFIKTPKPDHNWGPKPLYCEWKFCGDQNAELTWAIKFRVSECSQSLPSGVWTAFNFDETWDNDFEGQTRKTTKGYVAISQVRKPTDKKAVVTVEQVRSALKIVCPRGFKRVSNSWPRNYANNRIDFTIVDEQIEGDPYPAGVTLADGYCTFATNPLTMSKADISIGMTLKVAPGVPSGAACAVFMKAVAAKQLAMQSVIIQQFEDGTAIPYQLTITNRKYDGARITDGSCRWTLTAGAGTLLTAAGIWEPLTNPDYDLWRASMDNLGLWSNRGNADLRSLPGNDIILDACSNQSTNLASNSDSQGQGNITPQFSFSCPEIPANGGWVGYDPQVSQYRDDNITVHRKAVKTQVQFSNSDGQFSQTGNVPYGGGDYTVDPQKDHVIERGGYPLVKVLLQFKGLRFKYAPIMPNLKSIGGQTLTLIKQFVPTPKWVADVFECPIFSLNGWRLYHVTGKLKNAKPLGSKTSKSVRKTIHVGEW